MENIEQKKHQRTSFAINVVYRFVYIELPSESHDTSISTAEGFRDEYRPLLTIPRSSSVLLEIPTQDLSKKQDTLLIVKDLSGII